MCWLVCTCENVGYIHFTRNHTKRQQIFAKIRILGTFFMCCFFFARLIFYISFFHLLYYFTVAGQKYPIPFGCLLQKKKMKKTKFSTQKYPAVNFVLRKTLDATKMESAYIHTSIHVSSDENEKEKKPYRKIIIKDKINRYSLIKNDCRPTIFGGFFFVSFACAFF